MKIAVAGTGYVGLSNAILLAQHNEVYAVDIMQNKVDLINSRKSPIVDKEISEYLSTKKLNLTATTDGIKAYKDAEFIIISTPTNYDSEKNYFDTSSVEAVVELVKKSGSKATIIIKSTVPFEKFKVVNDLNSFKAESDVILANRLSDELKDCKEKVYTRDLFSRD